MATKLREKKSWGDQARIWLGDVWRVVLVVGASRLALALMVVMALIVAGWLVYLQVWRPLQEEVQLSPGIPISNPMINRTYLQQMTEDLRVRRRHVPASYFEATAIFAPFAPGLSPAAGEGEGSNATAE